VELAQFDELIVLLLYGGGESLEEGVGVCVLAGGLVVEVVYLLLQPADSFLAVEELLVELLYAGGLVLDLLLQLAVLLLECLDLPSSILLLGPGLEHTLLQRLHLLLLLDSMPLALQKLLQLLLVLGQQLVLLTHDVPVFIELYFVLTSHGVVLSELLLEFGHFFLQLDVGFVGVGEVEGGFGGLLAFVS